MSGRQQGGNERHGAPEQSQHVYSWVGDLGISCKCLALLQLELLTGKRWIHFLTN